MVHHPFEVWMRSFSSEEPWIKVCLIKMETSENTIIASPPAQLYHSQIPLKPAKLKDLQKIACQHVPPNHRRFYLCLRGEGEESDNEPNFLALTVLHQIRMVQCMFYWIGPFRRLRKEHGSLEIKKITKSQSTL